MKGRSSYSKEIVKEKKGEDGNLTPFKIQYPMKNQTYLRKNRANSLILFQNCLDFTLRSKIYGEFKMGCLTARSYMYEAADKFFS